MKTCLWERFDRIVVFDTETTGIDFARDEIIELGAVSLEAGEERESMDCLIRLSPGRTLPPFITDLTGITPEQLEAEGVEKQTAAEQFCGLLEGCEAPLLVAYNAQFDLNFLYHFLRFGFDREKIQFLAERAFEGRYDAATIDRWLSTFLRRFFISQFKRSCLPDGPKVGSVSLSPRGDWRMPSDASMVAFL